MITIRINFLQGEFKLIFKGVLRCVPPPDKIKLNFYLNKNSINSSEVKGNITLLVPFDDSLSVSHFVEFLNIIIL